MTPEPYLTKRGKQIFNKLQNILKSRSQDNNDFSSDLSMLANEMSKYEDAQEKGNTNGWFNYFDNGTVQVNAYVTMSEKSFNAVKSLSSKFGLNPKDLAALGIEKKEVEKPKDNSLSSMIASKGGKVA